MAQAHYWFKVVSVCITDSFFSHVLKYLIDQLVYKISENGEKWPDTYFPGPSVTSTPWCINEKSWSYQMFLFYLENDLNDLMLEFFPMTLSCHVIFFVSSSSVMSHVIYSVRAACLSPRDISFWRLIFTQLIFCGSIDQGISFLFQLWTFLLGNKICFFNTALFALPLFTFSSRFLYYI